MAVELLTPFSMVNRRTAIKGSTEVLTGRWVQMDGTNTVTASVDPTKGDFYLALEGTELHVGGPSDFDVTANSTDFTYLPSVEAVGAIGVAYGQFRYHVGPEGVDQSVAAFAAGDTVYLDTYGRLNKTAGGSNKAVAVVESVTGTQSAYTDITVRTLGA